MFTPLHPIQTEVVKRLITCPTGKRFNELIPDDLASEHMNYHLKQLIRFGYVSKIDSCYMLTDHGKDYTNLTDDEIKSLEKQPKTSVILSITRSKNNDIEVLVNRRLRQPYYGKVGRLTGKVQFGERLEQAAIRELYEETGLTCTMPRLVKIYHKLRRRTGEVVQDVIFYIFSIHDPQGNLITKTKYQENFWITRQDFEQKRFDFFDDFLFEDHHSPSHDSIVFTEHDGEVEGY
jgi:ADP-ribose pyrophosphatase YjhB (NUDIX family)